MHICLNETELRNSGRKTELLNSRLHTSFSKSDWCKFKIQNGFVRQNQAKNYEIIFAWNQ